MARGHRVEWTEDKVQLIEKAVELGISQKRACYLAGIDESTLTKRKQRQPDLVMRLKKAEAKAASWVAGKLMEKIRDGNLTAMIFWLKTRTEEFREKQEVIEVDEGERDTRYL